MKTIVIFCRNFAADKYPFDDPYYANGYQDLMLAIKRPGVEAYFATNMATYLGKGRFERVYSADSKRVPEEYEVVQNVTAGLVLEKGGFTGKDVAVLNPEYVDSITGSKLETYHHFSDYQPMTIMCYTREELGQAFKKIQGERIVVKEPEGNKGQLVYIGTKEEVLPQVPERYPLLVQEFVDMSVGIKGLVEGPHDLRVKIAGGTVIGGQLRTPAPGELRANLALGGTSRLLDVAEIPVEVIDMALAIDKFFSKYPRFYALDFANTTQGWKLIELNRKPGLAPADLSPQAKATTLGLADYMVQICPEI